MRRLPPASFFRAAGALLAAGVFVGAGVWEGGKAYIAKPRQTDLGPLAALARHADFGADRAFALDELQPEIEALAPEESLIVFRLPNDDRGAMASDVVDYLAWPRRVDHFVEKPGERRPTRDEVHQRYGGFVLCGTHAPPDYPKVLRNGTRPIPGAPGVLRVGPHLEVVLFENPARHP